MRFAYADPPYLGTSKFGAEHHYGALHPDAADYDTLEAHQALVERLCDEFPDGWALSLHTPSLRTILAMCPEDVRVAAWVKGWCSWKPGVNPKYAWEPVIYRGGRRSGVPAVRDWLQCNVATRQKVPGSTPVQFCEWVLALLGFQEGDELIDIFPGTGVMDRVLSQGRLA